MSIKNRWKIRNILGKTGSRVLLFISLFLLLFPIYWIFIASVIPPNKLISTELSWLIPRQFAFDNYAHLFIKTPYTTYMTNSIIIAISTTGVCLVVSSFAGYSLARLRYKGRKLFGRLILCTYILPSVIILIPIFRIMVSIGINNTRFGLILTHMSFAMPFCIWMLRGYFISLPPSLEEAALIDGATITSAFLKVILPLALPGLVAAAVYTFVLSWNEFLFAFTYIDKDSMRTIPVGVVSRFVHVVMNANDWTMVMVSSITASIPVYILFCFIQKHLVQGLAAGAVKE